MTITAFKHSVYSPTHLPRQEAIYGMSPCRPLTLFNENGHIIKQNEWNKRIRLETNVTEIASVCTAFVFAKLQAMVIMLLLLCCPLFRSSSSSSHRMRHQCPFVLSSSLSVFLPASSHSFNPSVRPFVLLCPPIPGLWSIRQNNSLKLISAQVKIHRNPFCGTPATSLSLWVRGN